MVSIVLMSIVFVLKGVFLEQNVPLNVAPARNANVNAVPNNGVSQQKVQSNGNSEVSGTANSNKATATSNILQETSIDVKTPLVRTGDGNFLRGTSFLYLHLYICIYLTLICRATSTWNKIWFSF